MDIDIIANRIQKRIPEPMDVFSKYGVLVPLIEIDKEWELIYEVRAKNLKRQPGEISFPGGAVENGETFREAAIRETCEELNIKEKNIEVLGPLDYLISYSNASIHPFVGIIKDVDIEKINFSEYEVDHIFTVPLRFFLENEPSAYYIDLKTVIGEDFPYEMIPKGKKYNWNKGKYSVYFYKFKNYIIWGLTAKISKNFIDIIKKG